MVFVQMAPMRAGSPAVGALPLPRRLIRQIQRRVAQSGRSLQRLEVSGRIIDNFDDLDDSDQEPAAPTVASAAGVANTTPALEEDDDLTSLSWLQDKNLLRGINLTKNEADDGRPTSAQLISQMGEARSLPPSPTSDYTEETLTPETTEYSDNLRPTPPTGPPPPPPPPVKPPAPYDPHAHAHSKPPYSFSCLIFMAIEASPARALPVKEIYAWIVRHFPYFREAPQGWKNSVRHNLSLNKCFHKVDKAPSLGKGSLWTVDPAHRATLVQAFSRAPAPPRAASPAPPRGKGAPDPQLFPFLARRLAGGAPAPAARAPSPPPMDEYLAAATVLAMKYGPGVLMRLPPAPGAPLVISSSPAEEHTYSGGSQERRAAEALLNLAGITPPSPEQYDSGEESVGHRPRLLRRAGRRRPADEGAEPRGQAPRQVARRPTKHALLVKATRSHASLATSNTLPESSAIHLYNPQYGI